MYTFNTIAHQNETIIIYLLPEQHPAQLFLPLLSSDARLSPQRFLHRLQRVSLVAVTLSSVHITKHKYNAPCLERFEFSTLPARHCVLSRMVNGVVGRQCLASSNQSHANHVFEAREAATTSHSSPSYHSSPLTNQTMAQLTQVLSIRPSCGLSDYSRGTGYTVGSRVRF